MVLPRVKNLVESSPTIVYRGSGVSTDDFNYLSRMAGARHPAPGELVLTESLFIETGLSTDAGLPPSQTKTTVQVDEIDFTTYDHIQEEDLLSFMDEVNSLWESDDPEAQSEAPSLPGVENKTRSWMGMRWCYHIPRVINEIVANPVPIPPTDVPNGWPTWQSNAESGSARLCDIYCQLRCWDYRHNRFVTISDFFVPWEQSNNPKYRMDAADLYESGTFGDFVAQWFDADLEEYEYHAKLLELASATRRIQIHDVLPSDKWELRWRSPISIDKDAEHKQTRLLVNALLASSVQVKSTLVTQAYQNALVSISSPQMTLSLCQISFFDYAHEVMSVSLTDTTVSLTKYGADHPELDVTLSTSLQVYVQNFVQLLNASVLPRVSIHGMIHSAQDSLTISTVVDPVALYLNHTTMLIISTMDKILTQRAEDKVQESAKQTSLLYDMRIILINETSHPIWYRQEGTYECLQVNANSRAAYSWLSLAYNPYYRMEFALEKTTQDETINSTEGVSREDSAWSDPCVIKENCITGRYFKKFGFLWVCVELRGMQTLVTLRPPVIFRNFSDSLVHLILNDEQQVKYACSGLDSSLEQGTSRREADSCPSQNTAHIMADTVSTFRVSRSGNLWSAPLIVKDLPAEFDLVKLRNDNRADVDKRAGLSAVELRSAAKFVVLHIEDADAVPFYGWIVAHRAECKAVLPNEFDPNQRQFTQRYGWMEAALWPAFTIENTADVAVTFSFQQKKKAMSIEVGACSKEAVSEINPFEASDIEVQR
uniref:Uncharacterized protein n=1 Tax=Globisporangium ultimum (strain ATCC 200006 / CBS 805.95 / DAOM BR144) TaxID=431595 RepID=K3X2H4_GLOUD